MANGEPGDPLAFPFAASLSPDGRWLVVAGENLTQGRHIVVFEVATGRSIPVSTASATMTWFMPVAWTLDSDWLLWPEPPGIGGFRPDDGTAVVLDAGDMAYVGVAVLAPPITPPG